MHKTTLVAVAGIALLGGCTKVTTTDTSAATGVTEADATKVTETTVATWQSMDATKIKALYAPDIVGYDFATAPLITDRATWDKAQDAFAAAKIDKLDMKATKIQIVGPDAFVFSSQADATSSTTPANNSTIRCTDVFHRGTDGAWLIVNENCSTPPKA